MVDYVTSGQSNEVPEELASEAYQTQVPSFWRTLGAEALSGYRDIEELEQRVQTDPNNPRNQQPGPDGQIGRWSPSMGGPIPATSQFTNQKDLQKQYSDVVQQQLAEHQKRDSVISRYQEAHSWPVNFAVGTAGFLLDPLNAGAMFMPGLGEETIGAALAKIGLKETLFARVATHVAAGITSGVAYQAPLSALKAGLSDPAVQEYGWRDALRDIAMQGAANGVFHGLWGVGKDIVRGEPSVESNQETSIEPVRSQETKAAPEISQPQEGVVGPSQALSEQPMRTIIEINGESKDITPEMERVVKEAQEEQVYLQNKYGIRTPVDPSEVAEGQKDLYQNGYAQGTPSQDLKTVKEDMEASKVNKTASQQPITTTPGETKPSTAEVDNQALEAKWKEVSDQKQPIVEWKYASGETHTETFEDTALRQAEQKELDDTQKMMDEIKLRESGYAQAENCLLEAGI